MEPIYPHVRSRQPRRYSRGQTLAEFSLTLPLLLLLVFGTIEFGRLFQAWVTLQNAAREAARYASTGQYDRLSYPLEFNGNPDPARADEPIGADTVNQIVPCIIYPGDIAAGDQRGTFQVFTPDTGDPAYTVNTYQGGTESLYATWFNGEDCDPTNRDHRGRREDIARLLSIMDVARNNSSALTLLDLPTGSPPEVAWQRLTAIWGEPRDAAETTVPYPDDDEPGWFNVVICSNRNNLFPDSTSYDTLSQPTLNADGRASRFPRFLNILDQQDIGTFIPAEARARFDTPYCMNNEKVSTDPNNPNISNVGVRWLDPGDSGNRVVVALQFNHPLITPLFSVEWVRMEVRRSAIVESFRPSIAPESEQSNAPISGGLPTPTRGPTNTQRPPTATFTPIPTATDTPGPTATFTPGPFSCDNLVIRQMVRFVGERYYMEIENINWGVSELLAVNLQWRENPTFPDMYLAASALNTETHWVGIDLESPFNTDTLAGTERDLFLSADRSIRGNGQVSVYEGVFLNAGGNLAAILDMWDFVGTRFTFSNPDDPANPCIRELTLPPEPIPTDPPEGFPTDTPTYTPNCATNTLRIEWVGFDTFGVVQLRIVNDRYQASALTSFNIVWPDPSDLNPPLGPNILYLEKVTLGGSNPDDGLSVTLWRGPDVEPPSASTEPTWITNGLIPAGPGSRTNLFLDFSGSGRLDTSFGFNPSMFNGTSFTLGCGTGGGTGGGGTGGGGTGGGTGGGSGPIFLATSQPPGPTNTPRPTNTRGPSLTPSATRPTNTPRPTNTRGPTPTPRPTNTATFTPSPTVRRLPTVPGSGGGEP